MRIIWNAVLFAGLALCTNAAPFTNGSFELLDAVTPLSAPIYSYSIASPPYGWSVVSGTTESVRVGYGGAWTAASGNYSLDLNGVSVGRISQTFDTILGAQYIVSFQLSGNYSGGPYSMGAYIDGSSVGTYTSPGGTPMNWLPYSFQFAAAGSSTTLEFADLTIGAASAGPALDAVSVTLSGEAGGQVPEPGSFVLLAGGAALLALLRARR